MLKCCTIWMSPEASGWRCAEAFLLRSSNIGVWGSTGGRASRPNFAPTVRDHWSGAAPKAFFKTANGDPLLSCRWTGWKMARGAG